MSASVQNAVRNKLLIIISFLLIMPALLTGQLSQDENHIKLKAIQITNPVKPGDEIPFRVKVTVEESWHINSNKPNEDFLIPTVLKLEGDKSGFQLSKLEYPKPKDIKLGFSDVPLSVYEGEFIIKGILKAPQTLKAGKYQVNFTVDYQSCNNSTCLAPNSASDKLMLNVDEKTETAASQDNADNTVIQNNGQDTKSKENIAAENKSEVKSEVSTGVESGSLASKLEASGLFLSLLIVFLGGLALNLTPCVYPLIPITVGYFGGQSEGSTRKLFFLGVLYVLGMALTYSVIGVITALSGAVFGSLLQNTFVILAIAAVLVALSLSMFGVYEFKLPDSLVAKAGGAKGGYFGAFFMGLTIGIVAAPCIGPFVLGLVTYVGAKADPYFGFLMFFFLAVGMGMPYLVLALFSGKIKNLPRAGYWMEAVKHIFGFMLLGMALYFLDPLLPKSLAKYLLPGYMIFAALYLLIIDKAANNIKGFRIFKIGFSVLIIAISIYMFLPENKNSADWQRFSEFAYAGSLKQNQPMVIDFYADWCIPCKELDGITFSDPKVISELKRFGTYKVDMTKSLSEETTRIRDRFKIVGMPTVLLINSKGEEIHRITGFVSADEFYNKVKKID